LGNHTFGTCSMTQNLLKSVEFAKKKQIISAFHIENYYKLLTMPSAIYRCFFSRFQTLF
jgi:hypothetical protein